MHSVLKHLRSSNVLLNELESVQSALYEMISMTLDKMHCKHNLRHRHCCCVNHFTQNKAECRTQPSELERRSLY